MLSCFDFENANDRNGLKAKSKMLAKVKPKKWQTLNFGGNQNIIKSFL